MVTDEETPAFKEAVATISHIASNLRHHRSVHLTADVSDLNLTFGNVLDRLISAEIFDMTNEAMNAIRPKQKSF
jgi:hypothetical protein